MGTKDLLRETGFETRHSLNDGQSLNDSWVAFHFMTISPTQQQASRLTSYTALTSAIIFTLLVAYIWFTFVSVTIPGKIELSVLALFFVTGCAAASYSIASRTFNKPMTYSAIICRLVLLWHLVWVFAFGSPKGMVDWLIKFGGVGRPAVTQESGFWFWKYAPYYFKLLPLAMLVIALVFSWCGMAFGKKHPVRFSVVILACFSPALLVAYVYYSLRFYL